MWAEGIPVKYQGTQIGTATIYKDGRIELKTDQPNDLGREILEHIQAGVVFGLSVSPIVNPGIDGRLITRKAHEKPIIEYGGLRVEEQIHHNFD